MNASYTLTVLLRYINKVRTLYRLLTLKFIIMNALQQLENFDLDSLDMFETMIYNDYINNMPKVESLQIIINNVEGDFTQLSEGLCRIAEIQ